MTLDGFCDHTAVIADEELHQFFNDLLSNASTLLFGRTTFQLMESSWPVIVKTPTGIQAIDKFAVTIENIPKIVFSRTLQTVAMKNSTLAQGNLSDVVSALKQSRNDGDKPILIGSRSLIIESLNLNLVDELQLCIHPLILGSGLPLFEFIKDKINLRLITTRTFGSGAVAAFFEPIKQ